MGSTSGFTAHWPIADDDIKLIADVLKAPWLNQNLESLALSQASAKLAPEHFQEVQQRREGQVDKVLAAVNERLAKEINYWPDRYIKLSEDVAAVK